MSIDTLSFASIIYHTDTGPGVSLRQVPLACLMSLDHRLQAACAGPKHDRVTGSNRWGVALLTHLPYTDAYVSSLGVMFEHHVSRVRMTRRTDGQQEHA